MQVQSKHKKIFGLKKKKKKKARTKLAYLKETNQASHDPDHNFDNHAYMA